MKQLTFKHLLLPEVRVNEPTYLIEISKDGNIVETFGSYVCYVPDVETYCLTYLRSFLDMDDEQIDEYIITVTKNGTVCSRIRYDNQTDKFIKVNNYGNT